MKLTDDRLRQIIKEELEIVMDEQDYKNPGPPRPEGESGLNQEQLLRIAYNSMKILSEKTGPMSLNMAIGMAAKQSGIAERDTRDLIYHEIVSDLYKGSEYYMNKLREFFPNYG